jgi:hypothetical protein
MKQVKPHTLFYLRALICSIIFCFNYRCCVCFHHCHRQCCGLSFVVGFGESPRTYFVEHYMGFNSLFFIYQVKEVNGSAITYRRRLSIGRELSTTGVLVRFSVEVYPSLYHVCLCVLGCHFHTVPVLLFKVFADESDPRIINASSAFKNTVLFFCSFNHSFKYWSVFIWLLDIRVVF